MATGCRRACAICGAALNQVLDRIRLFAVFGWALTMLAAMVAWLFFRAETLPGAVDMLHGLAGSMPRDGIHTLLWNAGLQLHVGTL